MSLTSESYVIADVNVPAIKPPVTNVCIAVAVVDNGAFTKTDVDDTQRVLSDPDRPIVARFDTVTSPVADPTIVTCVDPVLATLLVTMELVWLAVWVITDASVASNPFWATIVVITPGDPALPPAIFDTIDVDDPQTVLVAPVPPNRTCNVTSNNPSPTPITVTLTDPVAAPLLAVEVIRVSS
jgi:hypothetical protein